MGITQDLRHGLRLVRRSPGFALFVILALGVGIGANTALFTVINSLLLRPLPFQNVDRLVEISAGVPAEEFASTQSFSGVAAFMPRGFSVASQEGVANVYGNRVSANIFTVLGVRAALGRTFASGEDDERVVMLSEEYWRRISGDPNVLGQILTLDGERYVVVGVLPAEFTLQVRDANLFVPQSRLSGDARVIARLQPGVRLAQAQAEALAIARASNPARARELRSDSVRVTPIEDAFRGGQSGDLFLWQASVGLVLLITCANVGNLMLVRCAARRREIAVRTAIGAGRMRVAGQLLTESALLGVMGGALGVVLAGLSVDYLNAYIPANIGRRLQGADPFSLDPAVIAFAAGTSFVTVLLFGLAPAMTAFRLDLISCLRDTAKGATPNRQRLGQVLVVAEVALALVLLMGAGLVLKSLAGLERAYLGFSPDHVLRAMVEFPARRFPLPAQRLNAFEETIRRLKALPGIETVGVLSPQLYPFGGPRVRGAVFEIAGRAGGDARAEVYTASVDYFRSVRIPLLKGRWFTEADTTGSAQVAILSEIVAKRNWPDTDPIGRLIRLNSANPTSPWVTVVGVVGDVRNPVGRDVQPTAYRPLAQNPIDGGIVLVRTQSDPMSLASAVRAELRSVDAGAAEYRFVDLARSVSDYISPQRFSASIFGFFAFVGVLLAGIGVYGVMRYWVSVRIPEIGVRVALGASRRDVMLLVFRKAAVTTVAGLFIGAVASVALQRVIENQLYQVSPTDPLVFAGVLVLMGTIAVIAALVPARWAARVDPLLALHHE
jgi:putative ABC transport system permease protein